MQILGTLSIREQNRKNYDFEFHDTILRETDQTIVKLSFVREKTFTWHSFELKILLKLYQIDHSKMEIDCLTRYRLLFDLFGLRLG